MQEAERVPNPRRVTAEDSVCIKKSPSNVASSNVSVVSNLAAHGGDVPSYRQRAASPAAESAKTWFDDSNKNPSERGSKFYDDNDPPFFLRNKSSSDESLPNPYKPAPSTTLTRIKRWPHATSLMSRNQTVESSSEDFRSVIDDLTIENRKLRKKLRRYEQVHCGDLQQEKLFELRVHGLPAAKKRKLEKALQEFASTLGDSPDDDTLTSAFAQSLAKVPKKLPGLHQNASSSGTSNSRAFGDSAYASMSGSSNQTQAKGETNKGPITPQTNDHAVRAYLQSLSRGLLPKYPPILSEMTKKQVVVQRLEQLFTGSHDVSGNDSQSKQQQEVSQSAASADRRTAEGEGFHMKAEGRRESRIFTSEEELKNDVKLSNLDRMDTDSSGTSSTTPDTPDQRPTRPLDLDPSRAQIPEENIEYMKHLGFDSPHMQIDQLPAEDEGWIYLNLLTSMAQLHILNVTPEFVRNAVREVSTRLELSPDSARIRWKGGKKPTAINMDSGELSTHSSNFSYDAAGSLVNNSASSKSLENQSGTGSGHNQSSHDRASSSNVFEKYQPVLLRQNNPVDPHQYRPLFYHDNRSTESGGHSYEEEKISSTSSGAMESSKPEPEGLVRGSTERKVRSKIRKGADPIIFYTKAKFYTDLSRDDESMPYNCPLYTKNVKSIIGVDEAFNDSNHEEKGPLSKIANDGPKSNLERMDSSPAIHGLADARDILQDNQKPESNSPITFEASGIGGVVPGDNFAIDVAMRLQRLSTGTKVENKVVSTKTVDMLPSTLPPPSYAFLPFSSSSESDDGESDSDGDVDMVDEDAYEQDIKSYIPPKFLNSFSSEGNSDVTEDDDMSDDSSIDMLAHARETEPETVAAAEREFEKNIHSSDDDLRTKVAPTVSSLVATVGEQSFEKETTGEKKDSSASPARSKGTKKPSLRKASPGGARRSQGIAGGKGKAKQKKTRA